MKVLRHVETIICCMVLLVFMSMAVGTMGAGCLAQAFGLNHRIIAYFMKNVTFQSHIGNDQWTRKYPLEENLAEKYNRQVSEIKRVVDNCCTTSFPWSIQIHRIVNKYEKELIGYDIDEVSSTYEAVKYVQGPCSKVVAFSNALENEGYPFLYVQTPSRDSVVYCQGLDGDIIQLTRLERSRTFVGMLEEKKIRVMDIAQEPGLSLQYDSSGHWSASDGLLCASRIAGELNENYGFDFNLMDYELSEYTDLMDMYPKEKKIIEDNCGYTFGVPIPVEESAHTVTFAEDEFWEGSFQETLIRQKEEWDLSGDAYHNVFRVDNYLIYEIHNDDSKTNKGKKILVIGDSFNWPVSSYLSIGVEDIVVIHNASFTGSIMSYIRQMEPDVVLMIYSDVQFDNVYTEEAYDLK